MVLFLKSFHLGLLYQALKADEADVYNYHKLRKAQIYVISPVQLQATLFTLSLIVFNIYTYVSVTTLPCLLNTVCLYALRYVTT